jgi:uncharacterized protein YndB with AHSA1/START domain
VSVDIRSDRRFEFDIERISVWAAITRIDRYREWWPGLHGFDGTTFSEHRVNVGHQSFRGIPTAHRNIRLAVSGEIESENWTVPYRSPLRPRHRRLLPETVKQQQWTSFAFRQRVQSKTERTVNQKLC